MAERIHETVTHARNLCDNVQWSPMDATRTEWDYLSRVVEIAIKAGATTINIPDTVGYTAPVESADLIRRLIAEVEGAEEVIFATHCHNDLGMATANSLAAVEGGARQIECTINGLGERAGNTALEEVVMALKVRGDIMPFDTGIDTTKIMNISRRVATVSGFPVQFNKAIVGKNAFAHESGIHQDGMLKNAETFEIMRPADVGLKETNLVMGKHSGRAALRAKLKELGYDVGDNQLQDIFVRFKALADRKKEVYDEDIDALVRAQGAAEDALELKFLRVICGTEAPQSADLTLSIDGADRQVTAQGDGPVDATFNAIKALFDHTRPAAALPGPRGDRGHRRAGHRHRAHGGGRAHRDRPVRRHRHGGRQRQGLYRGAQPPSGEAPPRARGLGYPRDQLQGRGLARPRIVLRSHGEPRSAYTPRLSNRRIG